MNCRQKPPPHIVRNPAYRDAFQRLDKALDDWSEQHSAFSNAEKIDLVRLRLFGVVAGSEESATVNLPK
jgi:hypothetical protein